MIIKFKNGIAEIFGEQGDNFNVTVEESTNGVIGLKIQMPTSTQTLVDNLKKPKKPVVVQMKERGEFD